MSGAVDLSNCDREPIHLLGGIQPFGCLLALSSDWQVRHASANLADYLGVPAAEALGAPARSLLCPDAIRGIGGRLERLTYDDAQERLFGLPLKDGGAPFDILLHRVPGSSLVIEAEPTNHGASLDVAAQVRAMLADVQQAEAPAEFFERATRSMRALTGFDRVMLYRFDGTGAGEVVAEAAQNGLEPFLGLHYPASDIPQQARLLYRRNWLRIIGDVNRPACPILAARAVGGQVLDLSMSMLRSVSPIHIEYLQNMGVAASLSASILISGKLWGLFACHHMTPRHLSAERRTAAELFAQMFSLLLENRERSAEMALESRARAVHAKLVRALVGVTPTLAHVSRFQDDIRSTVACDGMAIAVDGEQVLTGCTPAPAEVAALVRAMIARADGSIFATDELGALHPPAKDYAARTAGLLVIPFSREPRDYLMFFRAEQARAVTWAGNPNKPATYGPSGSRLTPRKSFEAWRETVSGRSIAWSELDFRVAENLRAMLLEIVLRQQDAVEAERRQAQQRQELLIAELNHRVRNILSLIRGLIQQSRGSAGSVAEFGAIVGGRIEALARAHDQITVDRWEAAPLAALIAAEAQAYLSNKAERVRLEGPPVLLEPRAFSTMALVIHELMTNSAKYGALCDKAGSVRVTWQLDADGQLRLRWTEQGGPPVQAPTRRGFGTTIIERSIPYDLHGEVRVDYALSGLAAELVIPASYVRLGAGQPATALAPAEVDGALQPRGSAAQRVLLVEDTMIIALETEDILRSSGVERVDLATNVAQALGLIEAARPDFAVLDVNLGDQTSFPIADQLLALKVPFVFATGYGEDIAFPAAYSGVPVVQKPYSAATLTQHLP